MNKKKFKNNILKLVKNTTTGIFIGLGIMISVFGVVAFENLTSNPGDSGNQSLSSPILSKIGGIFDRDTMSLEAIANGMVNWKDCETHFTNSNATLSCSAGYTIVDHNCWTAMHRNGAGTNRSDNFWCKLVDNNTLQLNLANDYSNRVQRSASIKCCKYLVP